MSMSQTSNGLRSARRLGLCLMFSSLSVFSFVQRAHAQDDALLVLIMSCRNASELCSAERIKLLADRGADPNAVTDYGRRTLNLAIAIGIPTAGLRALIEAGADARAADSQSTPIGDLAFDAGCNFWEARTAFVLETFNLLVDAGAELNAKDFNGSTPLMRAAFPGSCGALVDALLGAGADAGIQNKNGETALDLALKRLEELQQYEPSPYYDYLTEAERIVRLLGGVVRPLEKAEPVGRPGAVEVEVRAETPPVSGEVAPEAPLNDNASHSTGLVGHWTGTIVQELGEDVTYAATMDFATDATGTIDYPAFPCGGALTLREATGDKTVFREQIKYGKDKCYDGGNVHVRFGDEGSLEWEWFLPDGRRAAHGTFTREAGEQVEGERPAVGNEALASLVCGVASSDDLGLTLGGKYYQARKFQSESKAAFVFADETGVPVVDGNLVARLAKAVWVYDNVIRNEYSQGGFKGSQRARIRLDTYHDLKRYALVQDLLARTSVRVISAVLTGGADLTATIPGLTSRVIRGQMVDLHSYLASFGLLQLETALSNYESLLTLVPDLHRHDQISVETAETAFDLYVPAYVMEQSGGALVEALLPKTGLDLLESLLSSLGDELLHTLPATDIPVTLQTVWDLQKTTNEVLAPVEGFPPYIAAYDGAFRNALNFQTEIDEIARQAIAQCAADDR